MREPENIDDLISKYFSGEALPEEAMLLEDWKSRSEANRLHFEQSARIFNAPVSDADVKAGWDKVRSQLSVPGKVVRLRPFAYWRVAASVAILIGLGVALTYLLNNSEGGTSSYYAANESRQVTLSDGTDITISPNSSLTLEEGFGNKERHLRLKGTAYFSVVHDEKVPFVVNAGGVFIKDIGTRFLIRTSSDTDTVHVHVDEGVVLMFDENGGEVEIKAGGSSLYVKSKKQIIDPEKAIQLPAVFNFSSTNLADVVAKLNSTYNTLVEIENPALRSCIITTQFDNEKLETVLSVITETLGISYEKTAGGYIIKGEKCIQ